MCVCVCVWLGGSWPGPSSSSPYSLYLLPARLREPLSSCDWCAPTAGWAGAPALGPAEAAVYLWLEKRLGQGPHSSNILILTNSSGSDFLLRNLPSSIFSVRLLWQELSGVCTLFLYILDWPEFWCSRWGSLPGYFSGLKFLNIGLMNIGSLLESLGLATFLASSNVNTYTPRKKKQKTKNKKTKKSNND